MSIVYFSRHGPKGYISAVLGYSEAPVLGKREDASIFHLSIVFWLYTALQCRGRMPSNSLVFHTSGSISSSSVAFMFLIFLRTESISSCIYYPSSIPSWLWIIFVIGSCWGFPSKFSKCCFHKCIRSSWLATFSLALPSAYFVCRLLCYHRLSIFNRVSNLIDLILYVFCLFF